MTEDVHVQPQRFRRNDLAAMLIIARRGALESLRDRSTLLSGVIFAFIIPGFLVLSVIRPLADDPKQVGALGVTLATLMLTAGLLNTSTAVGVASGVFAGEKEKGNLLPLLASPVSNVAIFGGKVLSAVLPAMLFAFVSQIAYLVESAMAIGVQNLRLIPLPLAFSSLLIVPTLALFSASVASIISSRVRTYTAAQSIGGFLLLPLWFGLLGLTGFALRWGTAVLFATIFVLVIVDAVLVVIGATTWRREEVFAKL